eukprot:TRINITY_DN21765_c0_g1_i2.p1 TRINITY_DN21765_c0_g1~~TRINITY_DN21765_c0_g1_i2.p1  ORF type:complete len:787 (-),score=83.32 TRINITY_DN21765_c0_g1_i2:12-2372(-)
MSLLLILALAARSVNASLPDFGTPSTCSSSWTITNAAGSIAECPSGAPGICCIWSNGSAVDIYSSFSSPSPCYTFSYTDRGYVGSSAVIFQDSTYGGVTDPTAATFSNSTTWVSEGIQKFCPKSSTTVIVFRFAVGATIEVRQLLMTAGGCTCTPPSPTLTPVPPPVVPTAVPPVVPTAIPVPTALPATTRTPTAVPAAAAALPWYTIEPADPMAGETVRVTLHAPAGKTLPSGLKVRVVLPTQGGPLCSDPAVSGTSDNAVNYASGRSSAWCGFTIAKEGTVAVCLPSLNTTIQRLMANNTRVCCFGVDKLDAAGSAAGIASSVAGILGALPGVTGVAEAQLMGLVGSMTCAPRSMRAASQRMSWLTQLFSGRGSESLSSSHDVGHAYITFVTLGLIFSLHWGVVILVRVRSGDGGLTPRVSWATACTTARFPQISLLFAIFFYQGLAVAVIRVEAQSTQVVTSTSEQFLCGLLLVVYPVGFMLFICYFAFVLRPGSPVAYVPYHPGDSSGGDDSEKEAGTEAAVGGVSDGGAVEASRKTSVTASDGGLVPPVGEQPGAVLPPALCLGRLLPGSYWRTTHPSTDPTSMFGCLFTDFTARCAWFVVPLMGRFLLMAALSNFPWISCRVKLALILALMFAYAAAIVILRPFRSIFDVVSRGATALGQALTVLGVYISNDKLILFALFGTSATLLVHTLWSLYRIPTELRWRYILSEAADTQSMSLDNTSFMDTHLLHDSGKLDAGDPLEGVDEAETELPASRTQLVDIESDQVVEESQVVVELKENT